MDVFEANLNGLLVDTFSCILRFEEMSLRKISNANVTVTEAHMLEAISKQGQDATLSEIAGALSISAPTATVAIKKLVEKGLVTKIPSADDGRKMHISLTSIGKKFDRAHALFHRKMVKNISGVFSEEEKDVLLITIMKLNDFFKEKVSG